MRVQEKGRARWNDVGGFPWGVLAGLLANRGIARTSWEADAGGLVIFRD